MLAMWITSIFLITWQFFLCRVESAASCTFPSAVGSRTWHDSDKGDLVFTTDQMTGWNFKYIGGTTTVAFTPTWECLTTTTDGTDIVIIVKSTDTVPYDSSTFNRPFLCMRLRAVTSVSYYYYLQYAEQALLDYERITMYPETSVSSVSDPFSVYCLTDTHSEYPSINEYHMLVLNGSESQAIQDCPPAMYELYTYTIVDTDAGTTVCDGGSSRLDMCSDIKRMSFNYTLCGSTAAYSANGSLFCLIVLSSGSYTLHTVYNEDSSADNSNTFQFTCFASSVASDGSVAMSVSPRSCTKAQTPTDQPQLGNGTIWGVNMNMVRIQSIVTCDFPCAFPSYLANLNWTDSDKGQLTFTTDSMTGWDFYVYGSLVSQTWKCFHSTTVDDNTYLILRGSSTFVILGEVYRPFLCLKLQQITDASYYYYLLWSEQEPLGHERITIVKDANENDIIDPLNELCVNTSLTTVYPTDNEYHLLIKQGSASSAIQDCPASFYGLYAYTVEDTSSGMTYCDYNDTQWDVCTDRQRMAINYTQCTTTVAYSGTGSIMCVFSLTSGSYVVHTVYNEDASVDNTNTFRFTCFVSSLATDGNLTVSQTPKSCTRTQTPSSQPTLTSGTVVGLNLHLSPFVNGLCPILTPTSDSSTNIAVIVGSVLGSVFLIGLIASVLLCFVFKLCCWKRTSKVDTETNNNEVKKKSKKLQDEMKQKEEPIACEEGGVLHANKNSPGSDDKAMLDKESIPKTKLLAGVSMIDDDTVNESNESLAIKEIKETSDTKSYDDPLVSPSSIDIAALAHIRSQSRMDTPFGKAPGDTKFQESRNTPLYNSFTLPLLQGKSLTSLSSSRNERPSDADALSQSLIAVIDTTSPPSKEDDTTNETKLQPPLALSHPVNAGHSDSNAKKDNNTKDSFSKRKQTELPDNPVIISNHFQLKNMTYMNSFMGLPRKEAVGPENDHDFREKKTHSEQFSSKPKANTILDIMSKEPGFKAIGRVSSPSVADDTIKDSQKKGNGGLVIERSNTMSMYRNKSGVFQIQSDMDDDRVPSALDETSEGIAYDDDNQKARKHVHFSPNRNTVRELTFNEFEYGVVEGKSNGDGFRNDKETPDVSSLKRNSKCDEDDSGENNAEDEDGNDGNSNDTFTIDNPRLKTAMSVIYSENSEDPDKMSLRGYNL